MKTDLSKRLLLGFYIAAILLSFMDAAVYLSMRPIWFFVNKTLVGATSANLPWTYMFLILFSASFLYSLILFIKYFKEQMGKSKRTKRMNIILPVILIPLFTAIDMYLYNELGSSRNMVLTNLTAALPGLLAILAVVFLIIFYPDLKICHSRGFRYITASVLVVAILLYLSNFGGVIITSGPVIQLIDDTNLSVVWTTNKNSTAYVEYGPDEKNLKREVAVQHGIVDANTNVHKVILPINTQREFIYRVGSTKIHNYYQNSVEYGNTVVSGFKKFSDYRSKDKIIFYILNDIHENESLYKKFLSKDDYDFLVLNGDLVNSFDSRKVIEDKILRPISAYTDGTKPFYFVRGNHETRGAALRDLPDYISLPQDDFYYTFNAGSLFAVVLDSAEDKLDSHEEYSGLADFEKYLGTETAWLQTLSQSEEYKTAKYKIAFVHIPLNDFDELEDPSYLKVTQQKWRELLSSMKIDAVFSGHAHSSQVIEPDGAKLLPRTFIGGGDSQIEKSFAAIKVEVTKESMKVNYISTAGEIINKYEVESQK